MLEGMDTKALQSLSFEDGYDRLEELIEQLEAGQLSLEESVALYEEGIQLATHCGQKLDDAELRISSLLNGAAESQGVARRASPCTAETDLSVRNRAILTRSHVASPNQGDALELPEPLYVPLCSSLT